MGYTQWRERQNARIDAMVVRADARAAEAKERQGKLKAEREDVQAARAAAQEEALLEALRARARELGQDHDDLMRRAAAVGMGGPKVQRRVGVVAMVGEVLASEGAPAGSKDADPYQLWWDRVVLEERCAAKLARGESLSLWDKSTLKLARSTSKT